MGKRRATIMLCVLLAHVALLFGLMHLTRTSVREAARDAFSSEPITMYLEPLEPLEPSAPPELPDPSVPGESASTPPAAVRPRTPPVVAGVPSPPAGESAAITATDRVDWPIEAKKSAARVLAAEAEAERIAKMFAGPSGTWASLTKRQRSKLSKFRWKRGVEGLERDDKGNTIYRMSEGCVLVNFMFIGCSIGKPAIHDDMFDNMRLYFDEQRLPRTDEGNGTEPEAQPRR